MQSLSNFIQEKLHPSKFKKEKQYKYHPKGNAELYNIIREIVHEQGQDADLNDIDISEVNNFANLFQNMVNIRHIDISQWNTSHVKDMDRMFAGCSNFDADLSNFDVSNVEDMTRMFAECVKFTGKGLENWNTESVRYKDEMFYNCYSLKNKPSWYKL
jgi:surface protein